MEGSPHCQQTEVAQVLAWMSLRVRERLYIEVFLIPEEVQNKEVLQLENRPLPAGPGRVMAPGSPPAARRNSVLSWVQSSGAPSLVAVPSRWQQGPPVWLAA